MKILNEVISNNFFQNFLQEFLILIIVVILQIQILTLRKYKSLSDAVYFFVNILLEF